LFILQSGLSARERRRLKQKQKGDKSAVLTPPAVAVLPSPNEVIAAKVRRSQEGHVGGRPTETDRFAYQSFRFEKRNERYACICNLILPATDQAKAVKELTSHVGETTRRRNDCTRPTIVCDF